MLATGYHFAGDSKDTLGGWWSSLRRAPRSSNHWGLAALDRQPHGLAVNWSPLPRGQSPNHNDNRDDENDSGDEQWVEQFGVGDEEELVSQSSE